MASFSWALVIFLSLTSPPTPLLAALNAAGVTAFGAALLLVLWTSVSPHPAGATKWWRTALIVGVTLVLWVPAHLWAEPHQNPWAWMAGFTTAACALLSWPCALVAGAALGFAAYGGSVVHDRSATASILTLLACAVVVWAMCQVLVWLLRLLWAAQAGREAQAELALTQERLRVSRELHDVLGHRLGVIALKAELAAGFADHDPERAAMESDEIRRLATEALAEARRAIRGHTTSDLPSQLRAAELVLGSAGISVTIDVPQGILDRTPRGCSELMAAVTREAVTNVLRHSSATHVSISAGDAAPCTTLTVTNDGVPGTALREPSEGTGLAGLAARCAALGARLIVARDLQSFSLSVRCPTDRAVSR
jgi:two-component system sensor histidine kinase DesK